MQRASLKSLKSPHVHQPRNVPNSVLLDFVESSLHSHDWLNHWPLAIDSTCSPSPFPEARVQVLKAPSLQLQGLLPWYPAPILKSVERLYDSNHSKFQGFQELRARNEVKDQIYRVLLIINHNLTPSKKSIVLEQVLSCSSFRKESFKCFAFDQCLLTVCHVFKILFNLFNVLKVEELV